MTHRRLLPAVLLLAFSFWSPGELRAQVTELPGRVAPRMAPAVPVPFGPGERLEYDVRLGALGTRGRGYMAVVGLESVRGRTAYHVDMYIEGGLLFAKVEDRYQSWFDVSNLVSLRFIQDVDEINYERYRHWEIYPEELRFERLDKGTGGSIATDLPLDDVSFFYFVRSLPLEVGKEYSFNRYFKEDGNPVIIKVLRKDTVEVPAGTFPTIVVEPVIQTDGLFEDGKAELHFSDDEKRHLILMSSKVPLIGSLSLHLRSLREGTPLRPLAGIREEEVRSLLSVPPPRPLSGDEAGGKR